MNHSPDDEAGTGKALEGEELRLWRRGQRKLLTERRVRIDAAQRDVWDPLVVEGVLRLLPDQPGLAISLYCPFRGEMDPFGLMNELHELGYRVVLPDVVARAQPLEFLHWYPGVEMTMDSYNIPIPKGTERMRPDVLVVPVVGFDAAGYRLGNGGGYYDRTLASFDHRSLTIGVGYEQLRLRTIYPQPHDIPLDHIVTEAGVQSTP